MRIALIGKMGSGKSEALRAAKRLGYATLSADEINGELLKSEEYIALIAREFPSAVTNGAVDRAKLAEIVFADEKKRARLGELAHPRILKRIEEDTEDPLVAEIPMYMESGAARIFDKTALITCSEDARRRRLVARGMSERDIKARDEAQKAETLEDVADIIVQNDGTIEELEAKLAAALDKLRADTY